MIRFTLAVTVLFFAMMCIGSAANFKVWLIKRDADEAGAKERCAKAAEWFAVYGLLLIASVVALGWN